MSTDRDVTRIVRSWLEEGATALPDRVLDTVLDRLPATPQRRSWWPARRFGEMNTFAKFAIAAAAVVVVALVGINLLPKSGGIGGPGASASPTPSASSSSAPSSSPIPSPPTVHDGALSPGTYVIGPAGSDSFLECPTAAPGCTDTVRVGLTVPDGWAGVDNDSIWLTVEGNDPPAGAGLLVTRGAGLSSDPCRPVPSAEVAVGSTAEEFASALAAHPLLDVTTPVDVTLAGYSGRYVDLQVPSDLSGCDVYRPWEPGLYAQGPAQRWHLWILEVGGQRVVVQSTDYAGTSEQDRTELQGIVDSIQFQP
jgi:hypothetical protein